MANVEAVPGELGGTSTLRDDSSEETQEGVAAAEATEPPPAEPSDALGQSPGIQEREAGAEPGDEVPDAPESGVLGESASAGEEPPAAEESVSGSEPSDGSRSRLVQLEREGEVAADFLERLLDIADLDGDIDVDVDGDRAAVAVVDSDEGRVPRRLVGPGGRVLEALQELTRLAVQTATGERSRLMLDVAGFRAERRASLVQLAQATIGEVRESGQPKALADMTAFERKVVHDEVTAAGLVSESEGVEPHRHIVIRPA